MSKFTPTQKRLPQSKPALLEIAAGQLDYDVKRVDDLYKGERSPYWDWVPHSDNQGDLTEDTRANPDTIGEYQDTEYEYARQELYDLITEVFFDLTKREQEVFNLLVAGLKEAQIASRLGISQPRVSKCRTNIQKKFGKRGYKTA